MGRHPGDGLLLFLVLVFCAAYVRYWHKSTNTDTPAAWLGESVLGPLERRFEDTFGSATTQVLIALLVQKYLLYQYKSTCEGGVGLLERRVEYIVGLAKARRGVYVRAYC